MYIVNLIYVIYYLNVHQKYNLNKFFFFFSDLILLFNLIFKIDKKSITF